VLPLETVIEKLISGKEIFSIDESVIKEGNKAVLTLFNPETKWTFGKENILSKSKNSAFLGQSMKGKAYGIYNNNQLILND
jgi:dihydroorotase